MPTTRKRRGLSRAPQPARDERPLLERILDSPQLPQVVPRLPPEVLHRVIQRCGLEDCGALVTLATPGQLAAVFDLDLWRSDRAGRDEHFDAGRFGVWLEVLVDVDPAVAAHTLAGMDVDLAIAAFAQHVRVVDPAAASPVAPADDDEAPDVGPLNEGPGCDIGGYRVAARRTDSWDAIVAALTSLGAEHHDYFHRVMRGCRRLSNSGFEIDGLDDLLPADEQVMFDLAVGRERRREQQGYVTPAQARAFLQMAREARPGNGTAPPGDPIARAYFQAVDWEVPSGAPPALPPSAEAVAAVVDVLLEAGIIPPQARMLLEGAQGPAPRLACIQAHMRFAGEHDPAAFAMRGQELAYLANTIVAGCTIQARPFTAQEASDAAVAVCNLGLENWPGGTALPDDFLVAHDLVSVFQAGWAVLHDDVCMYAAGQLIRILTRLRSGDREIQAGLDALRIEMKKQWHAGTPWGARDALDVISILDMPAWATLLALIDECPVLHAGIHASRGSGTRAVDASAFEFISENSQIAVVRAFMQALPETLRG